MYDCPSLSIFINDILKMFYTPGMNVVFVKCLNDFSHLFFFFAFWLFCTEKVAHSDPPVLNLHCLSSSL